MARIKFGIPQPAYEAATAGQFRQRSLAFLVCVGSDQTYVKSLDVPSFLPSVTGKLERMSTARKLRLGTSPTRTSLPRAAGRTG